MSDYLREFTKTLKSLCTDIDIYICTDIYICVLKNKLKVVARSVTGFKFNKIKMTEI